MNFKFKFINEEGYTVVDMPPNLMLALKNVKNEKRANILFYLSLTILSLVLFIINRFEIIDIFCGQFCKLLFIISLIVFGFFLLKWCLNKKAEAIKIFCCIMTNEFDEYIDDFISRASEILCYEYRVSHDVPEKYAKKIKNIITTAQLLKEIHDECINGEFDLRDNINFIEDNICNIYGFNIEEVKYGHNKKRRNRKTKRSVISVRGPVHISR